MKKQTSIQRALSLRKNLSARKKQRGSAIEWIILVILIIAALVPLIMWISHVLQENAHPMVDYATVTYDQVQEISVSSPTPDSTNSGASFDTADDSDSEAASTESEPDTAQMATAGLEMPNIPEAPPLNEGNPE